MHYKFRTFKLIYQLLYRQNVFLRTNCDYSREEESDYFNHLKRIEQE